MHNKKNLHYTSCTTSKLAAPALPTFTVIGHTSADRAKFWIFFGMVALKNNRKKWYGKSM